MEAWKLAIQVPKAIELPRPRLPREEQQEAYFRKMEIDPAKYTPEDVKRELVTRLPPIKINLEEVLKKKKDGE